MIRTFASLTLFMGFFAVGLDACGSDDQRCTDLCTVQPKTEGDMCSDASASACLDACNEKVGGVETACGNCLLEDATFNPVEGAGGIEEECKAGTDPSCVSGTKCVASANGQTCEYCEGAVADKEACVAKLNPLKEIECPTKFTEPSKCTAECGS